MVDLILANPTTKPTREEIFHEDNLFKQRSADRGQTNDEARMTNDEGMTKHECNVLALARARAHGRNRTSAV
jgi:hypothetical protein